MSLDILKKEIKEGKVRSLYLFYGQEEYLKRYYLDAIEGLLLKEGGEFRQLNRIVLEGRADAEKIIDNCETLPVFSDRKMVIVKNSGYFKQGSKESASRKGSSKDADLLSYLQNVPGHTCLVFYEEEIDKRLKSVDAIKKNGLMVEFPYQKPADLARWVVNKFRASNIAIDPQTASMLVDNCEQGMTDIQHEIDKLVLYLGDRKKVEAADIERVCVKSVKSRIFDLTDAIAEKNGIRALEILNDMIALKEPIPRILFMIAKQFRQILQMKLLAAEGTSAGEAASKMGITPYAAGKLLKHARSFTLDELKKAMEECLALDEAVKTGKMNDRTAVELLITGFAK